MYKKSNKDVLHKIGQVGKSTNKVTFFFLKLLLNQTKENEKEKRLDESGKEKKRLVNRSTNRATPFSSRKLMLLPAGWWQGKH